MFMIWQFCIVHLIYWKDGFHATYLPQQNKRKFYKEGFILMTYPFFTRPHLCAPTYRSFRFSIWSLRRWKHYAYSIRFEIYWIQNYYSLNPNTNPKLYTGPGSHLLHWSLESRLQDSVLEPRVGCLILRLHKVQESHFLLCLRSLRLSLLISSQQRTS